MQVSKNMTSTMADLALSGALAGLVITKFATDKPNAAKFLKGAAIGAVGTIAILYLSAFIAKGRTAIFPPHISSQSGTVKL